MQFDLRPANDTADTPSFQITRQWLGGDVLLARRLRLRGGA
jgi:hypothetical protein